jgi:hypothetical protein
MIQLFLEDEFDTPTDRDEVIARTRTKGWCFETYRVQWNSSCLALDGRRMLCWFTAPDMESLRQAMRQSDGRVNRLWQGSVHESPATAGLSPNVVVQRSFEKPVAFEDIQALETAGSACLATHRVNFVRTYFSQDRLRMACLYQAPDAEAVRQAQRHAAMPVDAVWGFERLGPEMLATPER